MSLSAARPASKFFRMLKTRNISERNLSQSATKENDVIIKDIGKKGLIILNRPKALNALNLSMVQKIYPVLKEWEKTKEMVVMKGMGDKAFCAGGDVKSLVLALREPGGDQLGKEFFRGEYTLNHLIGTYKIPYVAIIHGITMGGGVGLSVHGKYRIATEKTMFAMPETAIGLFPDVGGTYFLPRLKNYLGMYLGLTGHRLKGTDVVHAGIATHFVPSEKLEGVTEQLLAIGTNPEEVLKDFGAESVTQEFSLEPLHYQIKECFSAPTAEDVIRRLVKDNSEWAKTTIQNLKKMSPKSLKVTKKAIEDGAKKTFEECLVTEYRLAFRALRKDSDFAEGVRALLIDKDQDPKWNPKYLEQVSDSSIEELFKPVPNAELILSKL